MTRTGSMWRYEDKTFGVKVMADKMLTEWKKICMAFMHLEVRLNYLKYEITLNG